MQLTSVMSYLNDKLKKNRSVIENKLNSHFAKIKQAVDNYEKKTRESLKEVYKTQDTSIHKAE